MSHANLTPEEEALLAADPSTEETLPIGAEIPQTTPYMSGDYYNLTTPTGTSEDSYILHLRARSAPLRLLPISRESPWFPRVELALDLYHVWVRNHDHVPGASRSDWQFAASVTVGL